MMRPDDLKNVRVRLRDTNGRLQIVRVPRDLAKSLQDAARGGETVRVAVDGDGRVSGFVRESRNNSLPQRLRRFSLEVELPGHRVHVPPEWQEIIAKYVDSESKANVRILFYGPEGTGKDTLTRLIIAACRRRWGAADTAVLPLPAEYDDRYVGGLENKALELQVTISLLKKAGCRVVLVLPELGSLFARGDYTCTYDLQFQARLCDVLDGLGGDAQRPELVLASCNYTSELPPPLLSRFLKIPITITQAFSKGLLESHFPEGLPLNGTSASALIRIVVEKCYREPEALATLASRKKKALTATDLTAFNARFIADFCAEMGRRAALRFQEQAAFAVDAGFVINVLADHLAAALHPLTAAAGTPAIRKFLVRGHDLLDPGVAVEPTLEWCRESQFLAS